MPTLHVHLDESGNLSFTPNGTKHFVFAAAWTYDPRPLADELTALRFRLLKNGVDVHTFHAAVDQQRNRDAVVAAARANQQWSYAALVVEKPKINPAIRAAHQFYPQFATMLLRFVLRGSVRTGTDCVLVFTDQLPMKRRRELAEKAIKTACRAELPPTVRFESFHHPCASNTWIQVADYCAWAVFRKWERNDHRTYDQLRPRLEKPELNVTARGSWTYY